MRFAPDPPASSVDFDGYTTAYAEHGAGTPLVLVHGSLCDWRYWKPQIAGLGRHFRVLALSLRRYWPERWNGEGDGFSIAEHADQLLKFVEQVAGGSAHLVGHSRGGRVVLEAALRNPGLARSLTLADPGQRLPGHADQRGNFRQRARDLIRAGQAEEGLALFIDAVTGPDTWRRMVPWFKEMVRDNAATLLGQADEILPLPDEHALRALLPPVLLIGGALSPAPFPAVIDWLERLLPATQRVSIEHASHGMNLSNPRAFNAAIEAFLE
ncbi:MAG TPA: alpha/beta hydrolase [Bordetella sp.]